MPRRGKARPSRVGVKGLLGVGIPGRRSRRHSSLSLVAVAALTLALAGCSGGLGALLTKSPGAAYDLSPAQGFARPVGRGRGQLVVAEPTALGPLEGDRILVRPAAGQLAQLPDAQWEERLPRLVQVRLVQSFENAKRLGVGRPADKISADYALLTDLRVFEVSAVDGTAQVEIAAKIVNERSGRIIAARVLRASVPAQTAQGPEAVAAINAAFEQVAAELVLWVSRIV